MNVQQWNPDFIELSPIFKPFLYLQGYFKNQQSWPEPDDLNKLCALQSREMLTRSGKPVCFVPQLPGKLDAEQRYESGIYLTGQIPTRVENWHDFFNALVWQIFPRAKSVLNQLHYQAQLVELSNQEPNRCKLRDAATLLDESGVIVVCSQAALIQLIKDFEWKELFWRQRKTVLSSMRFFVFGHGLYEKALNPYTGMTGKAVIFNVPETFFAQNLPAQLCAIDAMLELYLLQTLSSSSDLVPVPLLGYPGWIGDNNNEPYYENKQYFRDRPKPRQMR
ncbi:DUF3025 domain-containing protein [Nitrosomonas oligotropha]|uniref:DUF3025 domain-containing protein n=1 Tax=Nitrosomonas oligotropha TaxID=42354 RepID=UPI00136A2CFA|nr:DUF3025 domain-containing protein [Nitrosomonas oligotropha]MXS81692.1 DUF3025 domain-containing protein [Nitrosomonas oligotropha]